MSRMRIFRRRRSADCDTPLSIHAAFDRRAGDGFLFESAEGGEHWGRYSIIGFDPARTVHDIGGRLRLHTREGDAATIEGRTPDWLRREILERDAPEGAEGLPFAGGAVGWFGWDIVHDFEPAGIRRTPENEPVAAFMEIDRFIVFDNLAGQMTLCVVDTDAARAEAALDAIEAVLDAAPRPKAMRLDIPEHDDAPAPRAHLAPEDYMAMVERAKEYILAGDIFQVVLSQRFSAPLTAGSLAIYRAVRHINPSPYLFHLRLGDTTLIGSSPEILVRKEGRRAIVRPIAGTRPRGATAEGDLRLESELLADEKERAEHVMLVDLGRNDLGRVCEYGSVRLTDSMVIERYSHVMHIVSQVEGRLREDVDALDLLAATFPAGTVSGAPKVRAMQIIEELEPETRGPYAGCIGHLSYGGGRMDTAIAIRTAVVRDGEIRIQAGAGIVADSVPENEHRECVNKAMAMFRAVQLAHAQGPEDAA